MMSCGGRPQRSRHTPTAAPAQLFPLPRGTEMPARRNTSRPASRAAPNASCCQRWIESERLREGEEVVEERRDEAHGVRHGHSPRAHRVAQYLCGLDALQDSGMVRVYGGRTRSPHAAPPRRWLHIRRASGRVVQRGRAPRTRRRGHAGEHGGMAGHLAGESPTGSRNDLLELGELAPHAQDALGVTSRLSPQGRRPSPSARGRELPS